MCDSSNQLLSQLIALEHYVCYDEPPPAGVPHPYVVVRRPSHVLVSAPHAARSWRANGRQGWHMEEEYTAALALLLGDLCQVSVIAGRWRDDQSDPNWHLESESPYKQTVRQLVEQEKIRWLIDLHGMRETRLTRRQRVDLGTRHDLNSLPLDQLATLSRLFEERLGPGTVSHNRFPARVPGRSLTAFAHGELTIHAVQVEMKQSVLIARRRLQAPRFFSEGHYSAEPWRVAGIIDALSTFIHQLPAVS
jgi:hypothetical protein